MKKIFSLAVVFCLALVGAMFVSCENEQKSSYPYEVKLAPVEQDPALSMQFELNGLPIINEEMEKAADQKGIIFKEWSAYYQRGDGESSRSEGHHLQRHSFQCRQTCGRGFC